MTPKKGDIWVCVKNVYMNGNPNDVAYLKGKVYWSDEDYSITDENKNIHHRWVVEDKVFYEHFRRVPKNKKSRFVVYL